MTKSEYRDEEESPPARKQAGKRASGLASKLDWIEVSSHMFDEEQWYNLVGAGDKGDRVPLVKAKAIALDMFVSGVTKGLSNCTVYFEFDFRVGSFSSGVLAFFNHSSGLYNANYVTSHISYGLDGAGMKREVDNVVRAISTELGRRMFTDGIEPVPSKLIKLVERTDK